MIPDSEGDFVKYADYAALREKLAAVEGELADAKCKLFPYADAPEIVGYSTTGIYLIGDRKSIDAASKAFHYSAQLEQFRAAFAERIAQAKDRAEAAEARATAAEAREAKLTEALEYVVSEYVLEGHVQEIVDAALTKEPGE